MSIYAFKGKTDSIITYWDYNCMQSKRLPCDIIDVWQAAIKELSICERRFCSEKPFQPMDWIFFAARLI